MNKDLLLPILSFVKMNHDNIYKDGDRYVAKENLHSITDTLVETLEERCVVTKHTIWRTTIYWQGLNLEVNLNISEDGSLVYSVETYRN